jgi:hypothetical protein
MFFFSGFLGVLRSAKQGVFQGEALIIFDLK